MTLNSVLPYASLNLVPLGYALNSRRQRLWLLTAVNDAE